MAEQKIITKIELIERYARSKEEENWRFRDYLKYRLPLSNDALDAMVQATTAKVWEQIDCKACANCCRTAQVMVDAADIARLAKRLALSKAEFTRRYISTVAAGEMMLSTQPCPFLEGNVCSVYEDRPQSCRDFPYLHEKNFRSRSISMVENTSLCPIVFNTYESLKMRLRRKK